MRKFEFTLSITKPEIWVHKIIVEASNINDAYYRAFFEFAEHMFYHDLSPENVEISYKELKN